MTSQPNSTARPAQPIVVSRYDEVRALLADPALTVPEVPRPPFSLTVAWLRGAVGRFADGPVHAARRAAAVRVLDGLDERTLRAEAFRRTAGHSSPELVPVEVLAVALGVRAEDGARAARAVAALAPAYPPPATPPTSPVQAAPSTPADDDAADAGLAELSRLLGDPEPERLAVLAGLLAQACAATAGLVRNALAADGPTRNTPGAGGAARKAQGTADPDGSTPEAGAGLCPVESLLTETLRHDPPVRMLRRVAVRRAAGGVLAGTTVLLDVAAANRDPRVFDDPDRFRPGRSPRHLTFGAGPRPCPAERIALALAAGVVEAVRR
ncbi:cytochrome P450 [Streptosporangium sp. NPDC004379]|uniref:cytochrome P450 n=1 Tax=Streptosporangium sp. NPDC004379 TaxID=3366189 RepID=UPI0036B5FCEA